MVWCNYFKWCVEKLFDEKDVVIGRQRRKISMLENLVRVSKKRIIFLLGLVFVIGEMN